MKTSKATLQRLLDTEPEPWQFYGCWPFMMCFLALWMYLESRALAETHGTGCIPYYKAKQDSEDCVIGYNYHFPLSDSTWAWHFEGNLFLTICFYCDMWPGLAAAFFLSLALLRRGCFEFFIGIGVALQGVTSEMVKRATQCTSMEHYDDLICQLWIRPHTSCLDDCGMFSGHTCVAYFYLGWGLAYVHAWRKMRNQYAYADQPELQPLLMPPSSTKQQLSPITSFLRSIKVPDALTNFSEILIGTFLFLQGFVVWIVGDHSPLQISVGAMVGLIQGWLWFRYIVTPDRVKGLCETPVGKFLGFYDNYSFSLHYAKECAL